MDGNGNRWAERPVLGGCLQALIVLTPLVIGAVVGVYVNRALPEAGVAGLPGWAVAGTAAMLVVWSVQPLVRRVLPLAWLLRLGMLFPGTAPSRFKVARRAGRVRDLEDELLRARDAGEQDGALRNAELVLALIAALTSHDRRTRGHAERTRVFTDLLTLEMGLGRDDRDRLRWAALLHDIGKLEVPARLLNKAGTPSRREWDRLRQHPEIGDRLIAPLRDWLGRWADTTLHHHERWDGSGYPQGLSGTEICLGGRIVAVADAYDVMTAARSYRRPLSAAAAREELVSCAGNQFDPNVVRAFLLIPLSRLRWALGPFSWVAQLPLAREVAHTGSSLSVASSQAAAALPAAAGAAATAATVTLAPAVLPASTPPPPAAVTDHLDEDVATAMARWREAEVEADWHSRAAEDPLADDDSADEVETASEDDDAPRVVEGHDVEPPSDDAVEGHPGRGRGRDNAFTGGPGQPAAPAADASRDAPGRERAEQATSGAQAKGKPGDTGPPAGPPDQPDDTEPPTGKGGKGTPDDTGPPAGKAAPDQSEQGPPEAAPGAGQHRGEGGN